ncbi:MAG: HlyD family efflux transporter periplasmic adaptor subunit [Lachnospirales bacterium]
MFNNKNNKSKYNTTKNSKQATTNTSNSVYGIYSNGVSQSKKKTNKKISYNNSGVLPICMLFFVLCVIYILGCAYGFVTKKIANYDVVQLGVIDTPKTCQGVIVRDEKVYTANADGVISYEVADNQKVKKNTEVCTIKDEEIVKNLESELAEIDKNIIDLQSEREDISIYSEDIAQDNKEIQTLIDDNAMDYAKSNFGNIYELKNNIQKKMDARNELLLTENNGSLTEYVTKRNQQLQKLNNNISKIAVEEGGIVSFNIDSLEDKYTIASLASLTEKQTKVTNSSVSSFKTNVKNGDAAFKLVKSNEWYIACYIKGEYTADWEKGNFVFIYAKDSLGKTHELSSEIYELTGASNDSERYCVLKIRKDMADFINDRSITFDVEKATSGYKIPNSAIVEETLMKVPADFVNIEESYVTKPDGTKINVVISDKNENENLVYILVQLGVLNVGDSIKKPFTNDTFTIKEVVNTKGVYVVNSGYAQFKRIYMDNSVSNSTHTILDVAKNTNVSIYDRISTNADNIKREEKVYS